MPLLLLVFLVFLGKQHALEDVPEGIARDIGGELINHEWLGDFEEGINLIGIFQVVIPEGLAHEVVQVEDFLVLQFYGFLSIIRPDLEHVLVNAFNPLMEFLLIINPITLYIGIFLLLSILLLYSIFLCLWFNNFLGRLFIGILI